MGTTYCVLSSLKSNDNAKMAKWHGYETNLKTIELKSFKARGSIKYVHTQLKGYIHTVNGFYISFYEAGYLYTTVHLSMALALSVCLT